MQSRSDGYHSCRKVSRADYASRMSDYILILSLFCAQVHLDDTIYDLNDLSDSIHIVRGSMRLHNILTQLMSLAPPLSDRFNYAHSELRGFEDLTEISFGRIKKQIVFKKVVKDADRFFEHYYTSVDNVKVCSRCCFRL